MKTSMKRKVAGVFAALTLMTVGTASLTVASAEEAKSQSTFEQVVEAVDTAVKQCDVTKPVKDAIQQQLDQSNLGDSEKELIKSLYADALGATGINGMLNPGYGVVSNSVSAVNEVVKAANSDSTGDVVDHSLKAVDKVANVVITSTIPNGGLVVQAKNLVVDVGKYAVTKVVDGAKNAGEAVVSVAKTVGGAISDAASAVWNYFF